jgi:hypothetical protein
VLAIAACYIGPLDEGERVLRPLRQFGPPLDDQITPTSYTSLQISVDSPLPRGRRYYWKAHLLKQLDDAAIDILADGFAKVPSPMSILVLQLFGGAVARVDRTATAYAHRSALWDCIPICAWEDPAADERNVAWGRALWEALQPHAGEVYVNNLGNEGEERVRAAFGGNYDRLAAIKRRYDPTNFFHLNQNITPA